ncbi:MAG TPA: group II truncated hemoglobin [Zoogloea sp.]|uniref:group II truncated hemoglobin n=1 Tax=Zoogloea sp. TaxID=49181 RepID=UPI002BA8B06F|nr:group II truncated hemoglobin [Zoogloea sp.]HMV17439.1 group II truncated hemoglobin [Rhodocyclaceae bacterium]HMV62338.1 group II truncated hemoglobin [Rhodocyclaceae bacterium]HMW51947.1 group II truncated hemoglobin [Rhodocyclaceae bacterium]HMY48538.1 group II truncated hemoglobin [Rhodocyclaceae bacterium]HMZ76652.1 group II truncated hemoglobin [Rhodocyclaceae bacterium]
MPKMPDPALSTPYESFGGEETIRRLVHRFYALMDALPEAWDIRQMHPADLSGSEQKLFMYLTGWLGGPPLYEEAYGHPRLRARHLPFTIGDTERDQWLLCMRMALDECIPESPLRARILQAIEGLADHMRNRPAGG